MKFEIGSDAHKELSVGNSWRHMVAVWPRLEIAMPVLKGEAVIGPTITWVAIRGVLGFCSCGVETDGRRNRPTERIGGIPWRRVC